MQEKEEGKVATTGERKRGERETFFAPQFYLLALVVIETMNLAQWLLHAMALAGGGIR